jgi:hypothetical protein
MKVDHLLFPFVPNEDYEGAVILFDIVIDESWYALVELLSHAKGRLLGEGNIERFEGEASVTKKYINQMEIQILISINHPQASKASTSPAPVPIFTL